MALIAKKPCSFGGKRFFIGEEIPAELVLNPREQAGFGVLEIRPDAPKADKKAEPVKPEPDGVEPDKAEPVKPEPAKKGKGAKGAGEQ